MENNRGIVAYGTANTACKKSIFISIIKIVQIIRHTRDNFFISATIFRTIYLRSIILQKNSNISVRNLHDVFVSQATSMHYTQKTEFQVLPNQTKYGL